MSEHMGHEHHDHDHDEQCCCGHDHEHHHEHEHEHLHHHEHEHLHEHDHDHENVRYGVVTVELNRHDEALVVSGAVNLMGQPGEVNSKLSGALEKAAARVNELGGIVGHIKASVDARKITMLSVTETEVMEKSAPESELRIIMTAIVFALPEEDAKALVEDALGSLLA
ncbi:MAG: hypothetical protein IJ072_05985 [Oscillospiraceae bacterium]|nr:hypothetical protein [Oscillospiraceae bacterium]